MRNDIRNILCFCYVTNKKAIYHCILSFLIFVISLLVLSSCQKEEKVISTKLPSDVYFVSIYKNTAIVYHDGIEGNYTIEVQKDSREEQMQFDIQNIATCEKSFSAFVDDNDERIENAQINLALYNGEPSNYLDLLSILEWEGIYDYTRLSEITKVLGFYESTKHLGQSIIEANDRYSIYDYGDNVSEVVELGKVESLKKNVAIPASNHIRIFEKDLLHQIICSAYLIKNPNPNLQYLLLNCTDFGIWLYEFEPTPMSTCVVPFAEKLPTRESFEIIDDNTASLFLGVDFPYQDSIALINNVPWIDGMAKISLYQYVITNEFTSQKPCSLMIDVDSHVRITNNLGETIDLIEFVNEVDEQYLIKESSFKIDGNALLPILFLPVGIFLLLLLDHYIKKSAKKRIINAKTTDIALLIRKRYRAYSYVFIFLIFAYIVFWFILLDDSWQMPSIIMMGWGLMFYNFVRQFWHPISSKTRIPKGAFCLLLRGFRQDEYGFDINQSTRTISFETELCNRVHKIVKKIFAIGMTKELYSPFGAKRIYFEDNEWKEKIQHLIKLSQLIIINVHNSESCIYEIRECRKYANKVICIITDITQYNGIKSSLDFEMPNVPEDGNTYFYRLDSLDIYDYGNKEQFDKICAFCCHEDNTTR